MFLPLQLSVSAGTTDTIVKNAREKKGIHLRLYDKCKADK
jgi:hypothetical protein